MDIAHQKMQDSFDQWFKTVGAEQKRVSKTVSELSSTVAIKNQELKVFSENIQAQLDKSINDIFEKHTIDGFKLERINQKLKVIDGHLLYTKKITSNVEELMKRVHSTDLQGKLLIEGLPIMMHLQICEAVNKIIKSPSLKREFLDFEI